MLGLAGRRPLSCLAFWHTTAACLHLVRKWETAVPHPMSSLGLTSAAHSSCSSAPVLTSHRQPVLDEQGSRRQRSDGPPRSRQYDQDPGYPESRSLQSYPQGQEEGPSRASNGALPGRRGRGKGGRGEPRGDPRGGRGSGRGRGSAGEEWPELQVWAAVQGHGI